MVVRIQINCQKYKNRVFGVFEDPNGDIFPLLQPTIRQLADYVATSPAHLGMAHHSRRSPPAAATDPLALAATGRPLAAAILPALEAAAGSMALAAAATGHLALAATGLPLAAAILLALEAAAAPMLLAAAATARGRQALSLAAVASGRPALAAAVRRLAVRRLAVRRLAVRRLAVRRLAGMPS